MNTIYKVLLKKYHVYDDRYPIDHNYICCAKSMQKFRIQYITAQVLGASSCMGALLWVNREDVTNNNSK